MWIRRCLREAGQIFETNGRAIVLFEVAYWALLLPILFQTCGFLIRLALRLSGYSYVTVNNLAGFLAKPATILILFAILFLILMSTVLEAASLLTAFQAAAFSRKLSVFSIFTGGLLRLGEQIRRRNGKLFLVVALHFILVHILLIYRILCRANPLKFILPGLLGESWGRLLIIVVLLGSAAAALPSAFLCFGCMVEQRSFRGGLERSLELMRRNYFRAAAALVSSNLIVTAAGVLIYVVSVVIMAFLAVCFAGPEMELVFLMEARDKIEAFLIFAFSIILTIVNYATLTVLYVQFDRKRRRKGDWEFASPCSRGNWLSHRNMMAVLSLITAISAVSVFDASRGGFFLAADMFNEIQITAHRGSSLSAPENTLEALEAAYEDRADFAEIDVQETRDGVLVLFHDSDLRRIDGSHRSVRSMTWEEVQKVDVGSWFSREYSGCQIPTLEAAMEFARGKLRLNIEIKYAGWDSEAPEKVAEVVKNAGFLDQCVITSTSLSYLERVKKTVPEIYTGYIVSAAYGSYYLNEAADFISLLSSSANRGLVEKIHESGREIHVWTVNKRSELERVRLLGVDNVITDNPVMAREILYGEKNTEGLLDGIRELLH